MKEIEQTAQGAKDTSWKEGISVSILLLADKALLSEWIIRLFEIYLRKENFVIRLYSLP